MNRRRIFLLGATGTIGRATARALVKRGHDVVCFVRPNAQRTNTHKPDGGVVPLSENVESGFTVREGDVQNTASIHRDGFKGEHFDAIVSCMASRTGTPRDAWATDYQAHANVLSAARASGIPQMVLLSAICVQKPLLEFQRAKLAFEAELIASGLTWSIVRPTAFFKSLSGQVKRVQQGKPFLVFGDGTLTSCKPVSDNDVAEFLVDCLADATRHNRVLPIGGPGEALTPRQQGEALFALLGQPPRFKQVPVALLDTIVRVLSVLGRFVPPLAEKAQLARIGRYYATESMLVWDPVAQRYSAESTPSTGTETLLQYYAKLVSGQTGDDRGAHAVF